MKNLLEKIKLWTIVLFNKIKKWFIKNWLIVVNYLVVFFAYSNVYEKEGVVLAELLLGLWLFISIAYGLFKLFNK